MQKGPITPKGFRDVDPKLAKRRRETINKIADVLEEFGFVPLETPIVEYAETLMGKYGEDEKLIYQFKDRGERDLALRYDLTVPLARYVANNLGVLSPTFSRYQIGEVFRGEKPQRGRYRQFTQFDMDTVGSSDLVEDAKVAAAALKAVRAAGINEAAMAINDRSYFEGLPIEVVRAWDKYYKIGVDGIKEELTTKNFSDSEIEGFIKQLEGGEKPGSYLKLATILTDNFSLVENKDFFFDNTLARGLDYYTGVVFEMKLSIDSKDLSIGGGGRYDKLIGMFAGRDIPAVGFSFGIDRMLELTA